MTWSSVREGRGSSGGGEREKGRSGGVEEEEGKRKERSESP